MLPRTGKLLVPAQFFAGAKVVDLNRTLELKGARNVRDLGGYPYGTEEGATGTTAFGAFLRAGSLSGLRGADFARLERYGLRRVIDVRSSFETRHWPDPFAGKGHPNVGYVHIPMLDQLNSSGMRGQIPVRMSDVYLQLLDDDADSFRCVFEALDLDDEPGCVLFHCRAGKDRTGVIAMLLLELAGVSDEGIVRDYAATGSAMTPSMWVQRALVTIILRKRVPRSLFVAHAEEMERTLEHLHERYGTARAYLEAYAGVAPDVLDRLAARLRGQGA